MLSWNSSSLIHLQEFKAGKFPFIIYPQEYNSRHIFPDYFNEVVQYYEGLALVSMLALAFCVSFRFTSLNVLGHLPILHITFYIFHDYYFYIPPQLSAALRTSHLCSDLVFCPLELFCVTYQYTLQPIGQDCCRGDT